MMLALLAGNAYARAAFSPEEIIALGKALHQRERVTSIALDFVGEYHDPEADGIAAWTVDDSAESTVVGFVGYPKGAPEIIVEARFDDLLVPVLHAGPRALTASERAQLQARDTVREGISAPCAPRYDSVALPHPQSDDLLLYALPVASTPDEVLLGGHHRFHLDPTGTRLLEADALSTACTRTTVKALAETNLDSGVAVRNLLDDTPNEIHVYLSLRYRVPLYIVTRDLRLWKVAEGRMQVVRESPGS